MILTLDVEGLEAAHNILQTLNDVGSNIGAVELRSRSRNALSTFLREKTVKEANTQLRESGYKAMTASEKRSAIGQRFISNTSNEKILNEYLPDSGRDFVTESEIEIDEIGEAIVEEIYKRWPEIVTSSVGKYKIGGQPARFVKKLAAEIASAGLVKGMKVWMRHITDRINSGISNSGGVKPLSENYARWKQNNLGFVTPIGKATGQLLDNLNPDGAGARNIRLVRSTTLANETGD